MELLASSYYAQLGMGGVARPMVVGDRLWLFSQTPNGPMQPLLMPNGQPASQMSPMRPLMAAGGGRPAYYNRHLINSVPRLPISAYSRAPASYNPHHHHLPFDARTHQQLPLPMLGSNKEDYLSYQAKFMPHLGATPNPSSSGLADLEKAFGSGRSDLMGTTSKRSYSNDCSDRVSVASGSGDGLNGSDMQKDHDSDTESEIDCEQVDE